MTLTAQPIRGAITHVRQLENPIDGRLAGAKQPVAVDRIPHRERRAVARR